MTNQNWIHVNQVRSEADIFDQAHFTLAAAPNTDVYASPLGETLHVYSAPITHTRVDKSTFSHARVTFSFVPILQFDQGGLILTLPSKTNAEPNETNSREASGHPAWIKIGIEVNEGEPWLSVVGKARNGWCDWSLAPLPVKSGLGEEASATIEMTRHKNALMVYSVEGDTKTLIRKVPWVFLDDAASNGSAYVGAYAARPDPESKATGVHFKVQFKNLYIDMS
ncbi:hypothetical protein BJ170DRAFT_314115 [Xylariales sp. AK1849]|nr:hypothetical protein BJ170DRAFT_314115 [Xylariales sp. AK1849]